MWVYYTISVILGGYYFITNKKNKTVNFFVIFFMSLLAAAPRTGYDTESFQRIYELYAGNDIAIASNYNQTLIPYLWLMRICYSFGIHNFYYFKFLTVFFLHIVIWKRSEKNTHNYSIWLFLYLCSTFSIDAIQHRNYIALCLFTISLSYLFEKGKINDIKFIIFLCLASMFHITFIIYFVFLISKYSNDIVRKLVKYAWILSCGFIIICFFYRPIAEGFFNIFKGAFSDYYSNYFSNTVGLGFLLVIIIYLPIILILFFIEKKFRVLRYKELIQLEIIKEHEIVTNSFTIIFPTVLLCLYSLSTERLLRNLLPVCLFSICNYLELSTKKERRKIKIILLMICVYIFIFENYITGPASDIVEAIWNGEYFFIE